MPWWGWVLVALAVAVIVPVKLKILNKIFTKKGNDEPEDY